jgi:hypothetical protein
MTGGRDPARHEPRRSRRAPSIAASALPVSVPPGSVRGRGSTGTDTMNLRYLACPVAVMAALVLAACGSTSFSTADDATPTASLVASGTPSPYAASPGSDDCLFGAGAADIEVGIADPTMSCARWVQALAGSGLNWFPISALTVPGSQLSDGDTTSEACDLTDGTQELYIEDSGGMADGNSICSSEEQNGWSPEAQPGPLASLVQHLEQANAQASASASMADAIAGAQQDAASDDRQLDSDVSQLGTDLKSWSGDVATAASDYTSLLSEPLCLGGSSDQSTYDDAQNVYDDGQSVYDDESALTNDTSSAQSDLGTLTSELSALSQDGSGTGTYAGDISAAQAAIRRAQAAVKADDSSKIQNEAEAVQYKTDDCGS